MGKNKHLEEINERVNKIIAEEIAEKFDEEFLQIMKESENITVPEKTHRKLRKVIDASISKNKKRKRSRRIKRYATIAAAILVVLMATGTVLVTTVDAFRERVFEIFFQEEGKYLEVKSLEVPYDSAGNMLDDWDQFWYPDYLPEGYALIETDTLTASKDMVFANENNRIIFIQTIMDNDGTRLDNESDSFEKRIVNEQEYYCIIKGDKNLVMWFKHGLEFTLFSSIDLEELILIAENVVSLKK